MAVPNEQMIGYWNGPGGAAWASTADDQDRELRGPGEAALTVMAPAPGESVLDVGCGQGTTTLGIAERVGAAGRVVGIDVSAPLLTLARRRATDRGRAADVADVAFVEGDAQTVQPPGTPFDAVFSRFGVMFFDRPDVAFANLGDATAPGGRLAFVCWATLADNPWWLAPLRAVAGLPGMDVAPAPDPDTPGPFAFADPDRVAQILSAGGWYGVDIRPYTDEIVDDLDRRVALCLRQGPAARALLGAPDGLREAATARVRAALAGYVTDGQVHLGRSAWIVVARRE